MVRKAALIALLLLTPSTAKAERGVIYTGNMFMAECAAPSNVAMDGFCTGYVRGILEGAMASSRASATELRICPPAGATTPQITAMTVKYLNENPEYRHLDAASLIFAVLFNNWQCKSE